MIDNSTQEEKTRLNALNTQIITDFKTLSVNKQMLCCNCNKEVKKEIKENLNYFNQRKKVKLCSSCFLLRKANYNNLKKENLLIGLKGVYF